MSTAIDILKRELADQEGKFAELQKEWKSTIEAGQRATNAVDAQARYVKSIRDAVDTLNKANQPLESEREVKK